MLTHPLLLDTVSVPLYVAAAVPAGIGKNNGLPLKVAFVTFVSPADNAAASQTML